MPEPQPAPQPGPSLFLTWYAPCNLKVPVGNLPGLSAAQWGWEVSVYHLPLPPNLAQASLVQNNHFSLPGQPLVLHHLSSIHLPHLGPRPSFDYPSAMCRRGPAEQLLLISHVQEGFPLKAHSPTACSSLATWS